MSSCWTSSDRAEVRDAAAAWTGRVNTVTARTDRVDVDASALVRVLGTWLGWPVCGSY